jgi:hypothetical protein
MEIMVTAYVPHSSRHARASASLFAPLKGVDGRNKSGHDDVRASFDGGVLPRMQPSRSIAPSRIFFPFQETCVF